MKKLLMILSVLEFFSIGIQAADINHIPAAFKSGKTESLLSFTETELDLSLPTGKFKCKKGEALARLERFLLEKKPNAFDILHHAEKNESGFLVAKLKTEKGDFRVNITYRTEKEKAIIQSIRIE